jgi:hypothetical protein
VVVVVAHDLVENLDSEHSVTVVFEDDEVFDLNGVRASGTSNLRSRTTLPWTIGPPHGRPLTTRPRGALCHRRLA